MNTIITYTIFSLLYMVSRNEQAGVNDFTDITKEVKEYEWQTL